MGNLTLGLKKFLQNKNTVTLVGVILAIFVLYFAYTMRIRSAINPIVVPIAAEQIPAGVQITESMIKTAQVPPSLVPDGALVERGKIIDKYSAADTIIPEGSLFYERTVVEKEQLPANIILDYPKGYVLYNLPTDVTRTFGNSVYPGNYIDIYLKATYNLTEEEMQDTNNRNKVDQIMYGKFIENIKVLAVKDAAGKAVFQSSEEERTPAMIVFALPQEYHDLLRKASYMKTYSTEFDLVPTNESLKDEPDGLELSNEDLKEWIYQNTKFVQ